MIAAATPTSSPTPKMSIPERAPPAGVTVGGGDVESHPLLPLPEEVPRPARSKDDEDEEMFTAVPIPHPRVVSFQSWISCELLYSFELLSSGVSRRVIAL